MEKRNLLLSIIIPVYNAEKYLRECLDSIFSQNMDNSIYEVICVDDGSKDSSKMILEEYEKKFQNMIVISKENGGPSAARNTGLKFASGKWIWFIDSDDYIVENCCKYLLERAEEKKPDFIIFGSKDIVGYERSIFDCSKDVNVYCEGHKNIMGLVPDKGYVNVVWRHFLKREIITKNNILFDEKLKYSEDVKFILEYKFYCEKGLLVNFPIYHYRQNQSSLLHQIDMESNLNNMKVLVDIYDKYVEAYNNEKELKKRFEIARCRALRTIFFIHCIYIRDYQRAKEALENAKQKGWFPFKVKLKIGSNSFKGILINLFNEMLEVEWIYLLLCKIRSKK